MSLPPSTPIVGPEGLLKGSSSKTVGPWGARVYEVQKYVPEIPNPHLAGYTLPTPPVPMEAGGVPKPLREPPAGCL